MNHSLNPVTLALVRNALDVATTRQAVHAHNIANAGTPGFKPFSVAYDNSLAEAQHRLADEARGVSGTPALTLLHDEASPGVELIDEISAMSTDGLQYQALIRALNKQMSIASMALSEGKK